MVPYDADLRTVYVESIPVTASREWLETVFSEFGQVAYISLPKFKNSNKIKVSNIPIFSGVLFCFYCTIQNNKNNLSIYLYIYLSI